LTTGEKIWTFGTLYWGSLYNPQAHLYRLTAVVVNRDGNGAIGQAVSSGLLALNSASSPHMTWSVVDGSAYPTQADVDEAVHYKLSTWLAIEVAENASQQLAAARAAGNASWDPTSVITATYVQARNQATIDGQVLAFFRPAITRIMAELNAQLAAEYLSANSGNAAAIAALAAAPQTIGAPVGLTYRNLAMYPTVGECGLERRRARSDGGCGATEGAGVARVVRWSARAGENVLLSPVTQFSGAVVVAVQEASGVARRGQGVPLTRAASRPRQLHVRQPWTSRPGPASPASFPH
jgi:hypothetical protein